MRRVAGVALAAALIATTTAHVGSPNMVFDGLAGPYPVRVIVRPPDVVPGIAEVIVRVGAKDVARVSIRPVFWRAGVKGAPTGDEIKRVPGSDDVYSGSTWLMQRGSYSVYVTVDGPRGGGTVIVPVNAFATGRLPLSPVLSGTLIVLGLLLAFGLLTIIRAAVGESLVPPGESMTPPQRRRATLVTAIAAPVLALLIFGGASWWNAVDADYQRTMFHPPVADTRIDTNATHRTLHLHLRDTSAFRSLFTRIAPDHGKMMHLFLVSTSNKQTFTHLHPAEVAPYQFETEVPWVPAGSYWMFGDVVLESGAELTVAQRIEIPPAPGSVVPSDADDSWDKTASITTVLPNAERPIGEGYSMAWAGAAPPLGLGKAVDLKFVVKDSTGAVAKLQPYLGMAAHAVVVKTDASVFIHLHPMGTVAVGSQRAFELRDRGDTLPNGRLRPGAVDSAPMSPMQMSGALAFPYEFPKAGRYRIWVQVKPGRTVLTGVFDVDVR